MCVPSRFKRFESECFFSFSVTGGDLWSHEVADGMGVFFSFSLFVWF